MSTPSESSLNIFHGHAHEDVVKFFFYFEYVVMRGKPDEQKPMELLSHLDGRAFEFFFEAFADKDQSLVPNAFDYETVKSALISQFNKPSSPEDDIHRAIDLQIDTANLVSSMREMERAFDKAGFNDQAKFGLLRKALSESPEILQFVLYRGASTYKDLVKVVVEYETGRKTFFRQTSAGASSSSDVFGSKKVLNRPDARGSEIEAKVDSLATSLADLTLIMKKKTPAPAAAAAARSPAGNDQNRVCSFCKELGHAANRCPKNPHRDAICERCGKMGHTVATCWTRPKPAAAVASGALAQPAPITAAPVPVAAPAAGTPAPGPAENPAMVVMEGPRRSAGVVAAAKRNAAGEALPKQVRFANTDIGALLNPAPPVVTPNPMATQPVPLAAQAKKGKGRRVARARKPKSASTKKIIQESVSPYDLLQELANASIGLKVGHLLRGDAKEAEKQLRRLFNPLRPRTKGPATNAVVTDESLPRVLKLVEVQIYATDVPALLDTGAVPNLISAELVEHLNLLPKATRKTITTADGSNSSCIGRLRNVPITFGHITVHIDFYTIQNAPLGLIIGIPSLEEMRAVIDLGAQSVVIKQGDDSVRITMQPDTGKPFLHPENTESEIFTTDSSDDESASPDDSSDEDSDEEGDLIVALAKETEASSSDSEEEETDHAAVLGAKLAHLPGEISSLICALLYELGVCAWSFEDIHAANVPIRHSFELTDARPIYHNPRRMPPRDNQTVREEVEKMLRAGIVKHANSAWSFPVVIARKKDGSPRFCVDYRQLNERIKPSRWPIPHIEEIFDELRGSHVFTTLDLFSGYWQIKMEESQKDITTFATRWGNFRFEVMPMGLINAPSTFQRMMDEILKDIPFARAYLDDVVVFSTSMEQHLEHLSVVLRHLAGHELRLRITKCFFCQDSVELLGHIVSAEGIRTDPKKVQAVKDAPVPMDKTGIRSFLGLVGYYRRFISGFADISIPLHALTSPKVPFNWTEEAQEAFEKLKEALTTAPVLAFPDFELPFIVETDASAVAVGAVLAQKQKGRVHPIQFASRSLGKAERNYSACEREAIGAIFALR